MALLEELLKEIDDAELRSRVEGEVKRLKDDVTFGLVFEKHLPESVLLASSIGIQVGDEARQRSIFEDRRRLRVQKISGKTAEVAEGDEPSFKVPISDLLVVKRFDDSVYPTLTSVGTASNTNAPAKPPHLVLEGENYHALELLRFTMRGQVEPSVRTRGSSPCSVRRRPYWRDGRPPQQRLFLTRSDGRHPKHVRSRSRRSL